VSLQILWMIFAQAPAGLFAGAFEPDERTVVRGWPARVIGLLLLYIGIGAVVDLVLLGIYGEELFMMRYMLVRFTTFIASIVIAAALTALFSEKQTDVRKRLARQPRVTPQMNVPNPWDEAQSPAEEQQPPPGRPWQKRSR
jgi:hypothetical protein